MNVSSSITMNYEQITMNDSNAKQTQTKPISNEAPTLLCGAKLLGKKATDSIKNL